MGDDNGPLVFQIGLLGKFLEGFLINPYRVPLILLWFLMVPYGESHCFLMFQWVHNFWD